MCNARKAIPRRFNSTYIPQPIQPPTVSSDVAANQPGRLQTTAWSIGVTDRQVAVMTGQQGQGKQAESVQPSQDDSRATLKSIVFDRSQPSQNESHPQNQQSRLVGATSSLPPSPFATLVPQEVVQYFAHARTAQKDRSCKRVRQEQDIDGRKRQKTGRQLPSRIDLSSVKRSQRPEKGIEPLSVKTPSRPKLHLVPNLNLAFASEHPPDIQHQRHRRATSARWHQSIDVALIESARISRVTKIGTRCRVTGREMKISGGRQFTPISAATGRNVGIIFSSLSNRKDTELALIGSNTSPTAYRPLHMVPQSSERKSSRPRNPKQAADRHQGPEITYLPQSMLSLTGNNSKMVVRPSREEGHKPDSTTLAFRSRAQQSPVVPCVAESRMGTKSGSAQILMNSELKFAERAMQHGIVAAGAPEVDLMQRERQHSKTNAASYSEDHNGRRIGASIQRQERITLSTFLAKDIEPRSGVHRYNRADEVHALDTVKVPIGGNQSTSHIRASNDGLPSRSTSESDGATADALLRLKKPKFRPSTAALEHPHMLLGLLEPSGKQSQTQQLLPIRRAKPKRMGVHSSNGFHTAFSEFATRVQGEGSILPKTNSQLGGDSTMRGRRDDSNVGRSGKNSSPSLSPPVVISRFGLSPVKIPPRTQLPANPIATFAKSVGQKRMLLPFPTMQQSPSKSEAPPLSEKFSRLTSALTTEATTRRSPLLSNAQSSTPTRELPISVHLPVSNAPVSSPTPAMSVPGTTLPNIQIQTSVTHGKSQHLQRDPHRESLAVKQQALFVGKRMVQRARTIDLSRTSTGFSSPLKFIHSSLQSPPRALIDPTVPVLQHS
ncbi:hypothetical protein NliqN6_1793 [Naganishia liquefaciens]|uniref:Uncharacterized protein n=1 Tax=Naganishia liquefaciens TaxID=104408 RepID=A0A8H3YF62_9TREE|nr:hypothetical protein NliqN6_1793 [Naganishia liquefaciens]